jgi:hypothetical protein
MWDLATLSGRSLLFICLLAGSGAWLILSRWRTEKNRTLGVVTLSLCLFSVAYTTWGLLHIYSLRQRAYNDFGFEGLGCLLAGSALVASCLWLKKRPKAGSVLLTLTSAWIFMIFFLMASTI